MTPYVRMRNILSWRAVDAPPREGCTDESVCVRGAVGRDGTARRRSGEACPGAKGAPIVPNQTVAYELVKLMLPQMLPGYGLEKAQATAAGSEWNVEADVALAGASSGAGAVKPTGAGSQPPAQKGVLEVRIDGCNGAVLSALLKP